MRKNPGQNLVEFGIIISLVAIAGVLVLTFLGNDIKNMFKGSSQSYSKYEPFDFKSSNTGNGNIASIKAGSLGGTAEKPVSKCENGSCAIDFGTFALANVPENLSDSVDAIGTGGTSLILADLINQIASQLEADGKTEEAAQVKTLSNIGHNLGLIEKRLAEFSEKCNYDRDCMDLHMNDPFPYLSELDNSAGNIPADANYYMMVNSFAMDYFKRTPEDINIERGGGNIFTPVYFEAMEKLQSSQNLSPATINVIEELSAHYKQLAVQVHEHVDTTNWITEDGTPIPGEYLNTYKASEMSHLDGALICAAGKQKDSGTKCHDF